MSYALRMSGEIRDWLAGLSATSPLTSAAVVHALTALADDGPDLGPPMVVALDEPPRADPIAELDDAYQERLERMEHLRRTSANADELITRQAELDAFRVRKETLRARHAAATAQESVSRLLADVAARQGDDEELARQQSAIAEGAEQISDVTAQIWRELGREPWPDGLYELRPAVPDGDVRLIFALEPPGVVLLISVLEGHEAIAQQHEQAVTVSAEILTQVRAGDDPEASAVEFADSRRFADEFVARGGAAREAEADAGVPALINVPWLPFALVRDGHQNALQVTGDGLILTGGAATDLFVDPAYARLALGAGRLAGTPPDGDFTLAARVTVDFRDAYDAGALLVYAGERLWAKLCLELSPQRSPATVTVVTKDTSDVCNSFDLAGRTLWLRVSRSGAGWAFHASSDREWWRLLRYFSMRSVYPVRVGFMAQSPQGQGCAATFERIAFRPGAPSDLRDGS